MNFEGGAIKGAVALRSKGVIQSSLGGILLGSEEIKLHIVVGVHRMSSEHGGKSVGGVESGALCVSSVKKLEKVVFRSSALS